MGDKVKQLGALNGSLKKADSFSKHSFTVVARETQFKGLSVTAENEEQIDCDVLECKLDLERASRELAQANSALFVLASSINKKRNELENKIANCICSKILPLVEDMCGDPMSEQMRVRLLVLATYLENMTPLVSRNREILSKVSPREFRIAELINKNCTTVEIARFLKISPHTVIAHRRSLRKKLNIRNSKVNLATFLKLKLGAN